MGGVTALARAFWWRAVRHAAVAGSFADRTLNPSSATSETTVCRQPNLSAERFCSRMEDTFADKMLAMMRNQFGGHAVKTTRP